MSRRDGIWLRNNRCSIPHRLGLTAGPGHRRAPAALRSLLSARRWTESLSLVLSKRGLSLYLLKS